MKKVIGILSIVLSVFVGFQSMIAGLGNTIANNGEASGSAGFILAIIMLISGILTLISRESKGVLITAIVFYILGGITGLCNIGSYTDLQIWSILNLIFAGALIFKVTDKKKAVIIVSIVALIIGSSSIILGNSNDKVEISGKSEDKKSYNFAKKVVLDNDICKLTVLEPFEDETMCTVGYKVLVENKTDKTINVGLQNVSVDGVMNDPCWAIDITPKDKAYSQIEWITNLNTNKNVKSIDDIKNVKAKIYIMDSDTFEELCNKNIKLLTGDSKKEDTDNKEDNKTSTKTTNQNKSNNSSSKKQTTNNTKKNSNNTNNSNSNTNNSNSNTNNDSTCDFCGTSSNSVQWRGNYRLCYSCYQGVVNSAEGDHKLYEDYIDDSNEDNNNLNNDRDNSQYDNSDNTDNTDNTDE